MFIRFDSSYKSSTSDKDDERWRAFEFFVHGAKCAAAVKQETGARHQLEENRRPRGAADTNAANPHGLGPSLPALDFPSPTHQARLCHRPK
ncbi:unnamed protein product [Nippostrongylus brasiliensis]|uniref:Uncharacterized protein n=1 Tax=Nippostrongylus brasiliensis TaxID=27835 RepID=A0A0N4XWS6_NIPBR|nr:unnamed protein product [Nippostrongylus brasiliensis]